MTRSRLNAEWQRSLQPNSDTGGNTDAGNPLSLNIGVQWTDYLRNRAYNNEDNDDASFYQRDFVRRLGEIQRSESLDTSDDESIDMMIVDEESANNNIMRLRDFMELDIDEYPNETDFTGFLLSLKAKGRLSHEDYSVITTNQHRPAEITPEWLRDYPRCDHQGICWPEIPSSTGHKQKSSLTRAKDDWLADSFKDNIRSHRFDTYNCEERYLSLKNCCTPFKRDSVFNFRSTFTVPRPHLVHFQLRNLICPVSRNEVYISDYCSEQLVIKRLNTETSEIVEVVTGKDLKSNIMLSTKVSTLAANEELVVAGGFHGQYVCKRVDGVGESLKDEGLSEGYVTRDPTGITNHVSILGKSSKTPGRVIFASNDFYVREFDVQTSKFLNCDKYQWAVNCSAYNPRNSNMRLLVGDSIMGLVVDAAANKTIATLSGHSDYGFACSWSSDGYTLATGNQDGTCRVFDIRNTSKAVHVISSQLFGAIRSLTFDSSGRFLAFSEPIDYVTILDANSNYEKGQVIELYGDIGGIGFTEGAYGGCQYLTIGNCDENFGGIFQYERKDYLPHVYNSSESFII